MKEDNSQYIIEGGEEGKARLNVLSDALFSSSKTLLEKLGLKENMYFLFDLFEYIYGIVNIPKVMLNCRAIWIAAYVT